jgi:hypothetical protein
LDPTGYLIEYRQVLDKVASTSVVESPWLCHTMEKDCWLSIKPPGPGVETTATYFAQVLLHHSCMLLSGLTDNYITKSNIDFETGYSTANSSKEANTDRWEFGHHSCGSGCG